MTHSSRPTTIPGGGSLTLADRAPQLRTAAVLLFGVGAVLLLHVWLAQGMAAAQSQAGTVEVRPDYASVDQGDLVTVSIWLADAVDAYGLDVRLSFDPDVISATDIVPRWDLFDEDHHILVKREWDNEAGTIWYAVSNQNPAEPFTGTGRVCSLVFQGQQVGTSPLAITYAKGATRDGEPLSPSRVDGEIETGAALPTLTPKFAVENTPYAIHTHTLTLSNRGNAADTYLLTHASTDTSALSGPGLQYNWGVVLPTNSLEVGAGLSRTLRITVQVPTYETTWVTHTLRLTATSAAHPDRQVTSTLKTHTGGEWDPADGRWERCRFDYYGVGTVYFGDAQLVYDHIGTTDPRYRNYHESTVFFGDAQLVYDHIGQSCAP